MISTIKSLTNGLARVLLSVLGLYLIAAPTLADWQEMSSMPTPRSEMAAAHWQGTIYVPGGLGGTRVFEGYDVATDTWRRLAPLPAGRHHLMVCAHAGMIYVFSGADEAWRATNTAWVYDPGLNRWTSLAPMPEPRYAGAAVSLGRYIYAVGGDGPSGRLLRYDPGNDQWVILASTLSRREHTAAAELGGRLYAIGGRFRGVGELRSTEVYDTELNQWVFGPPLRSARGGFAAIYLENAIYVLGGEIFGVGRRTLSSTERLIDTAREWRSGPDMPIALHGVAAAAVDDSLFILGGSERAGGIVNRGKVFRYRLIGQN